MTDAQTTPIRRLAAPQAVLLEQPRHGVPQTSEMLFGETCTPLDRDGDWVKVENHTDGHVGWLPPGTETSTPVAPTHRVSGRVANLHPAPTHKAVPVAALSFGSLVTVTEQADAQCPGGWVRLDNGLWTFGKQLEPVAVPLNRVPVETALRFLETPYVWGGRSAFGIDCSGLVQVALRAAGITTHHSSGMQRNDDRLGPMLSQDGFGPDGQGIDYRRGDIVFFPGHVGIMLDGATLLHATVFTMSVVTEPLADVAARAEGITGVRRPVF
ncbi:C40 family peptidase [Azospirillum sp. YIM DDC1]|uniref:C40 family peptidase n=1 Tax=Azospirillum aestuarii TaxID=2802052 RepID=A0ABS1HZY0_9PROT|nr:NlpC/P60 family protein [Azospirillum aestuarii]MBK3778447.1 peptidase [Azospirillum brasilense]MBK4720382.1 C40 family peptidase [Azospirillum aestuarii]